MTREAAWLDEAARRWADRPHPAPRSWFPQTAEDLWIDPALAPLLADRSDVYARGQVAWGRVAMAAGHLWEPGDADGLGRVAWCDDSFSRHFPQVLDEPCLRLWDLRTNGSAAPALRRLVFAASEGLTSAGRTRFPAPLSGGRVLWQATCLLVRAHLPGGRLIDTCVPLVRAPDGRPTTPIVLPASFWPIRLRERWERTAAETLESVGTTETPDARAEDPNPAG